MGVCGRLVCVLLCVACVSGARILMLPADHQAHVNFYAIIGEELQARGHHVHIVLPQRSQHLAKRLHTIVPAYEKTINNSLFEQTASTSRIKQFQMLSILADVHVSQVRHVLTHPTLMRQLQSNKYDLALVEAADTARAMYLLPYKLGIKYISINVRHDPLFARVPSMPSVEGMPPFIYLHEHSVFHERLLNTLAFFILNYVASPPSYVSGITDDLFTELVPEMHNVGFAKLFQDCEMFLVVMDILCTDAHRVSAPHYQFVGGLGARDAQPLPPHLQNFMDSAQHGVIVMTLGSGLKRIPMDMLDKIMPVFANLTQRIVMRHDGDKPSVVPDNVLIESWMPQNDLLGHPNTRLFITHVGNNGQLEAVYHGVPMLMMPFFGDQFYNSVRAIKRGYGLEVNPKDFTINQFNDTVLELLNNPKYDEAITRCSNILHALPSPQHTAAFWIEHVLTFGSSHLKPYYMDMPLWKFYMLDILLFLFVVDVVVLAVVYLLCARCCCRGNASKSKTD